MNSSLLSSPSSVFAGGLNPHQPADVSRKRPSAVSASQVMCDTSSHACGLTARSRLMFLSIATGAPMRAHTTERTDELAKAQPLTALVVTAISEARRVVFERLSVDGIDAADEYALLLLDTAAYHGARADFARRASDLMRDTGEVSAWMARQDRELERDFAHINAARAA